jgi:hypothetical protein
MIACVAFRSGRDPVWMSSFAGRRFVSSVFARIDAQRNNMPLRWPVEMDLPEAGRLKQPFSCDAPCSRVALPIPQSMQCANVAFIFSGKPKCADVVVDAVTGAARTG